MESCTFEKNKAYNSSKTSIKDIAGSGGGFYFTCDPDILNCKFVLSGANTFTNNYADIKGGAIYWD